MIRRIRPRHALVMTCLALFVLAGTAYAVTPGSPPGPSEEVAFANVLEDGTFTLASNNLPQSAVTHPAAGVYCFTDIGFTARSAVVSGDNAFGNNDTIASVVIDVTGEGLAGCPEGAIIRVRTLDANGLAGSSSAPYAPALVDHRFVIWLRGTHQ
jgi:hypothetical protein